MRINECESACCYCSRKRNSVPERTENEPSAKEVNAALDRLGDMTASLPADYKALTSYFDRLYESYYKETEPSGDETEDLLVYPEVDPAALPRIQ